MDTSVFDFTNQIGSRLSGRVEHPTDKPVGWAIVAHCFACTNDALAATRLSRQLARHGIGVLRFDFAGSGSSAGLVGENGFASDARDIVAAADAMSEAGMTPFLLIGHSFGGSAALAAASNMSTINAVATINAPSDVTLFLRQFDVASLEEVEALGETEVHIGTRDFIIRQSFLDEFDKHALLQKVEVLAKPLIIFHSPRDEAIAFDHGQKIYAAAKEPKSFMSLDNADHQLTMPGDAEFVGSIIGAWATRYVSGAVSVVSPPDTTPGPTAEEIDDATYGKI